VNSPLTTTASYGHVRSYGILELALTAILQNVSDKMCTTLYHSRLWRCRFGRKASRLTRFRNNVGPSTRVDCACSTTKDLEREVVVLSETLATLAVWPP
jgi:hypothetical protein